MNDDTTGTTATTTSVRLWPGVMIAIVTWLVWYVLPLVFAGNAANYIAAIGGAVGGLLIVLWWAFFSRARLAERLVGIGLIVAGMFVTPNFLDISIATGGMGLLFYFYAVPVAALALVGWAVGSRNASQRVRWVALVTTLLLVFGGFTLVRSEGSMGPSTQFAWRWSKTAEERLLEQSDSMPSALDPAEIGSSGLLPGDSEAAWEEGRAEWPGFRGPRRDGVVAAIRIATDWEVSAPSVLWRRPVGPAWSSFAVDGERLYTQEQRGEEEIVACYDATSGEPIWMHSDRARFWEAQGGAGPRGTPTLSGGLVYAFGATGILNALDAETGALVWSRGVAADTGVEVPDWAFSSSPLVVGSLVIVAAAGQLAAYDAATGEPRWTGPAGGDGYSSPHMARLDGVAQVVLVGGSGAVSVAPSDGAVLWEHEWKGYPIVQPAVTGDGGLLISASQSSGLRRLAVARSAEGWRVEERWTTRGLKPYFNDFVVHEGNAYGFDGRILASIDLATGDRNWKGGRYGQGQLVLLSEQDLLLIVAESGDLALVEAKPEGFRELGRATGLAAKTWNHPVLVGDRLFVRNAEEMAAFRLAAASD